MMKTQLSHDDKIHRISLFLKRRKSTTPLSLHKKAVSHEVPHPHDKKYTDEKLDVSDLNDILHIDVKNRICIAEPGVTFVDLVTATLKYELVPIVVPELKTITIGGAVAGCSIESMSYKHGGFHDSCLEYEVITATGDVLRCTPTNKNKLVFQMVHGTFGTLGIISKLTFKLIKAKPFVHVTYEKYGTLDDYKKAIWSHFTRKDVDFMDGIIHSPTEYVLSLGNFVDAAPYTHRYDWMRIYYLSTKKRKEDYLKTQDYFFRYDKGVTNVSPKSFLGRLLFGKFINSSTTLRMAQKFHKFIPETAIPITLDVFIPFSRANEFLNWYEDEIDFFPLWCVPYKRVRDYEWVNPSFLRKNNDKLYLDLAIYGMKRHDKNYYKLIEQELLKIGALKTLISGNEFSENDFWKIWNKKNFDKVKKITDPHNIFRDLYEKTCRASKGMGR